MPRIATTLSLCILLCAEAFAERNVQSLIDSGDIKRCFLDNGMLQLSNRGLQSLRGVENIPNAEEIVFIDASYNQIKDLATCSFERFSNLTQLWLNHNHLEDLSGLNNIAGLGNLRELHLTHNKLHTFDLQQLSTLSMLYVLNLGFNQIRIIKPKRDGNVGNLEILFLNNNNLGVVPSYAFIACPHLQALYLQDNTISVLETDCFKGLFALRLLYLYNNALTALPSNVFIDLQSLHILFLRNNAIQVLEKDWRNGLGRLHILDLSHNKLNTEKEGGKDCEIRYPHIKKILDNYKRPFTVLDIGASEGYFSLRIASEYDCTCVMIEGDNTLLLPHICQLNKKLSNVVVLEKFITPQDLKELGECEHFDLVLAFNVVHQMKGAWKESIDYLLTLGDHVLIETPPPGCRTAANAENLPLIEAYLAQNKNGSVVAQVPRYGRPGLPGPDQKYSNVYLFEMHKNVLPKPTWGSPNIRFYPINSTWQEKTLYKPRIHKTIDWKAGINLWTFKNLNGVYPAKSVIHQEIKRLAAFPHGDFVPWNMVIQGNSLTLIDWDDNTLPAHTHNDAACIAQFES